MIANQQAYDVAARYASLGLSYGAMIADWVCVVYLVRLKLYRVLPVFATYIVATALSDSVSLLLDAIGSPVVMGEYALTEYCLYVLEVGVALELLRRLLDCNLGGFERRKWNRASIILILFTFWTGFSITGEVSYHNIAPSVARFLRIEMADGLSRVLLFVVLLFLIQVFHISWTSMLPGVTACLTGYFALALLAQIAHALQTTRPAQFDFFDTIECVRMIGWILIVLLLIHHLKHMSAGKPLTSSGGYVACATDYLEQSLHKARQRT